MQLQLLKTKRAETLISVIVGVTILAIVVSGIIAILSNSSSIEDDYIRNNRLHLIQLNLTNIVRNLPTTSSLTGGEIFYLEKNTTSNEFIIHTGSNAGNYGYIDQTGENVTNTGSFTGNLYLATFRMEKNDANSATGAQVIKATLRELLRR